MTTLYKSSNAVPAWQYTQELDAREALKAIEAQRSFRSTRRFRGESVTAHRIRLGLTVSQCFRGNRSPRRTVNWSLLAFVAGVALFWGLIATIFIKSLH